MKLSCLVSQGLGSLAPASCQPGEPDGGYSGDPCLRETLHTLGAGWGHFHTVQAVL